MTPLMTATTQEIFEELASRFDSVIVTAYRKLDSERSGYFCEWHTSNYLEAIGLAEYAKAEVLETLNYEELPGEG